MNDVVAPKRPVSQSRPSRKIPARAGDTFGFGLPPKPPKPTHKTVTLELKLPKATLPKLPYRQYAYALTATVVTLVVIAGTAKGVNRLAKGKSGQTAAGTKQAKPDFTPVVPLDKPDVSKVQGATSTYDADKHVLTYIDTYENEKFTVSQQPLPDGFKTDTESLSKLAATLGTKQTLDTQQGAVYLATNPKTQQQTAVFITPKLLLFIRVPHKIGETTWQEYINKLKV